MTVAIGSKLGPHEIVAPVGGAADPADLFGVSDVLIAPDGEHYP